MVLVGSIIKSLSSVYDGIREYNRQLDVEQHRLDERVHRREQKVISVLNSIKAWSFLIVPGVISYISGAQLVSCTNVQKELDTAMAHINVGNYNTAKGLLDTVYAERDILPDEAVFRKLSEGRISSEAANLYFQDLYGKDFPLHVFHGKYDSPFVTSLEKLVAPDGNEFFAIGDDNGNFYFFNQDISFRTRISAEIQRKMHPLKKESEQTLLASTEDGLVYEIGLEKIVEGPQYEETEFGVGEKERVSYRIVSRTLFDAGERISELHAFSYPYGGSPEQYFFTTKTGKTIALDARGNVTFERDQKRGDCKASPLFVADVALNPSEKEVLTTDCDNNVIVYGQRVGDKKLALGLSGDITDFFVVENQLGIVTNRTAYVVDKATLNDVLGMQADTNGAVPIEPSKGVELDIPSRYGGDWHYFKLMDSHPTLIYVWNDSCGVFNLNSEVFKPQTRDGSFEKGWSNKNSYNISSHEHFTTQPLLADIDADGKIELIVGTSVVGGWSVRGRVYVYNISSGAVEDIFGAQGDVTGERIKYDTLNGTTYLAYASHNSVTLVGQEWFSKGSQSHAQEDIETDSSSESATR